MPSPVLLATALPLHLTSAKGSRNKIIARRKAAVEGIFVPNIPVEEVTGAAGVMPDSCKVSIVVLVLLKKITESIEKS